MGAQGLAEQKSIVQLVDLTFLHLDVAPAHVQEELVYFHQVGGALDGFEQIRNKVICGVVLLRADVVLDDDLGDKLFSEFPVVCHDDVFSKLEQLVWLLEVDNNNIDKIILEVFGQFLPNLHHQQSREHNTIRSSIPQLNVFNGFTPLPFFQILKY